MINVLYNMKSHQYVIKYLHCSKYYPCFFSPSQIYLYTQTAAYICLNKICLYLPKQNLPIFCLFYYRHFATFYTFSYWVYKSIGDGLFSAINQIYWKCNILMCSSLPLQNVAVTLCTTLQLHYFVHLSIYNFQNTIHGNILPETRFFGSTIYSCTVAYHTLQAYFSDIEIKVDQSSVKNCSPKFLSHASCMNQIFIAARCSFIDFSVIYWYDRASLRAHRNEKVLFLQGYLPLEKPSY